MHYAPLRDTGGWDCLWVHFNPRPAWLDALKLPRAGKGIGCFHVAQAKQRKLIELALRRCVDYANFASAGDMYGGFGQELALAALEEAIFLVARELTLSGGSAALSEPVRKVVELLDRHLAQEHSLTVLAREARLSPSRLTHRFKEETGESVIGYLMKLRLRRAAQMLQLPERSVKEVAFSVGFRSPFYFSRQFRNHFNTSPQEFQRRALAGPKPRSKRSNSRKKKA
jgi:AraC family transcriptional regulator of arabinose operon